MNFLKAILGILLFIWQLPQNLVALIYRVFIKGERVIIFQKNTWFYVAPTMSGGVSLGQFIFLSSASARREPVYDHEYGHCLQSLILGPLYLFIIGIPSGIHCLVYDGKGNYYDFYTEKWANKLGKIEGYSGQGKYHKEGAIHWTAAQIAAFFSSN